MEDKFKSNQSLHPDASNRKKGLENLSEVPNTVNLYTPEARQQQQHKEQEEEQQQHLKAVSEFSVCQTQSKLTPRKTKQHRSKTPVKSDFLLSRVERERE